LPSRASGRWEAAVEHYRQAERLDPRSSSIFEGLGDALLRLPALSRAREVLDRGLALAPANLYMTQSKAMTYLAEGDLAGARAVLKAARRQVEPTALVAYFANYFDLVWVLDEEQRELLLRLTPSAFDDVRSAWASCLVQAYALKGDAANVRTYAEEARKAVDEELRAAPNHRAPCRSWTHAGIPRAKERRSGRAGVAWRSNRFRRVPGTAPTTTTSSCGSPHPCRRAGEAHSIRLSRC
jgi:tetratricopeptide (TPR) repeat protein